MFGQSSASDLLAPLDRRASRNRQSMPYFCAGVFMASVHTDRWPSTLSSECPRSVGLHVQPATMPAPPGKHQLHLSPFFSTAHLLMFHHNDRVEVLWASPRGPPVGAFYLVEDVMSKQSYHSRLLHHLDIFPIGFDLLHFCHAWSSWLQWG